MLFSEAKPNLCLYQRNYRTQKIKLIFIAGKWEKGNETVLLRKNEKKRTKKNLISSPSPLFQLETSIHSQQLPVPASPRDRTHSLCPAAPPSQPHVSAHFPDAVRRGRRPPSLCGASPSHRERSSCRTRGPRAPRRGLVPHAAAPRGARRKEAPRWGRSARRGRGRSGGGGGGVGRGAAGVRGVDRAHAGAAGPGDARLLGGTPVGGPRLLRPVHVGVWRRLRREYTLLRSWLVLSILTSQALNVIYFVFIHDIRYPCAN